MVKQGDIIKINFNPQAGHEQAGYRPAVVVSNNFFNQVSNITIVCPITNTNKKYPLHIALDSSTETTGTIMCQHIRALDLESRSYKYIERLPKEILKKVIDIVFSEIEII